MEVVKSGYLRWQSFLVEGGGEDGALGVMVRVVLWSGGEAFSNRRESESYDGDSDREDVVKSGGVG